MTTTQANAPQDMSTERASGPLRDEGIPDLMSLTEVAELLSTSRPMVHKLIMRGEIVAAQAGTTWVFRREIAERFAKSFRTAEPASSNC